MKFKTYTRLLQLLLLMLIFPSALLSQTPSGYLCSVRNDSLLTARIYEFDIYLQNTDPVNAFELGTFQAGIVVNSSVLNGGAISTTIVAGSSQLVLVQQPISVSFSGTTGYCIRLAPRGGPGFGAGTIISRTSPGTRVVRIRLTNSSDFGQVSPNFVFNFTASPYNTVVSAYDQSTGLNTNITLATNHTVTSMYNPILNGPLTSYNVTGSGASPSVVGLNGSQTGGVGYLLNRNTFPQGSYINGTGSAMTFGSQTEGTYTIRAHRRSTYMYSDMTGSAIITAPAPLAFAVTGGGAYCQGTGGGPVGVADSETGVIYTLIKDGSSTGTTMSGTGSAISFGSQLFGTYTVSGNNTGGTTFMTGSAVLTENPLPLQPASFTASTATVCQGVSNVTYTVPLDATVTYNWSYSGTGATIIGTTNSVTVSYSSSATSGTLSVTATNGCGTSPARTISVTVNPLPVQPAAFTTSSITVCQGVSGVVYTVPLDPTATYAWSYSGSGATITGTTNSVTVNFSASATSGTLSVTAGNGCGVSIARTVAVTVNPLPVQPAVFTASTTTVCQGISGVVYTVPLDPTVTYAWNYSGTGATITGTTNSVSVNFSASATSGTLSVTAGNGCGVSIARTVAVTVNPLPVQPAAFSASTTTVCQGVSGVVYTVPLDATVTYAWSYSGTGAIITGTTNSVTVSYSASATSGTLSVTATNGCGTSIARTIGITVNPGTPLAPVSSAGSGAACTQITANWAAAANATSYRLDVSTVNTFASFVSGYQDLNVGNVLTRNITGLTAGTTYYYRVRANNTCGTSPSSTTITYATSPATPAIPGAITGTVTQCPALTGQTYSISSVTNASTYTWTVPLGWTITGGQGTTSVTVTTGSAGQNGNISVTAGNTCGTSAANTLAVTVTTTPATPGAISGTTVQCPAAAGQLYSISSVLNATTYAWTVPTGWSITAGQGSTSITVSAGGTGQNGNITVTAGNTCGSSALRTLPVSVSATPATPGVITGTTAQCPSLSGQIYSIGAVTYATTYTWTVPSGWSVTTGQGTTSITVVTGTAGSNGNITVTAGNSCGTSAAGSLAVTVNPGTPAVPAASAGTGAACTQINANWTASVNATSYRLDVSTVNNFASFVSGYQDLNVGNVTTSIVGGLTAGTTYYYRVRAVNSCGTSASSVVTTYATSPATPAIPGAITGTTPQCPAITGQIYSITAVTNATTYTWIVPTGWSITGGQGTTSVTVTTGASGDNGNITVTAGNTCGTSAANTLAVTVSPGTPAAPVASSGSAAACTQISANWTAAVNATSYRLDVSTVNTFISYVAGYQDLNVGNVTTRIVTGLTAGTTYYYRVRAVNSCGTSASSTITTYATSPATPAVPGAITGTTTQCPAISDQIYSITNVLNATTYAWTVPSGWTITSGQGSNSVTVTTGGTGQNGNITVTAGNTCGTSAARTLAVTVSPGTPAAPAAAAGTGAACTQITANWTAAANAASYRLDVSTVSTFATFVSGYQDLNVGNVITTPVIGLTAGTTYYYRVRAVNSCGTSASSIMTTYATSPATPVIPGSITGTSAQCPSLSGQLFSIGAVNFATTYTWTVPSGWVINSGQGTTSISVTTGTAGSNGSITVTAGNSCGTSTARSLAVMVNPGTPVVPLSTAGSGAACTQLAANWNLSANATRYYLDVSTVNSFAGFVPGFNNLDVGNVLTYNVTGLSAGTTYYYRVRASNSCGTSASSNVTSFATSPATPAAPGSITGLATQCPASSGQTYSIVSVTNATTYTWTVPSGWTITAGQGTPALTVTTGATGQNGNITVTAGNSCGTSTAATRAVNVIATPATPGIITGTINQCPGLSGQTYLISSVTNASTYNWNVPAGWTITSGQGTTSITVSTGIEGNNGNISVTAENSCGISSARTLTVIVNPAAPAAPGLITGSITECPGLTGQIYSITAIADASTYTWGVPTGWSITAGQGTTSVTVTTGGAGQNGNITVNAGNSCGTSSATSLAVTVVSVSTAPSGITITNNNTCNGTQKTLAVSGGSLGAGASWRWFTGSCGGTMAGTGPSINVDPPAGTSTTYYVLASGTCNTTACASGTVIVTPTVGTPAIPVPSATTICQGGPNTSYTTSATNATGFNWTITGTGNTISGTGTTGTVTWAPGFSGIATISVTANGCGGPSATASTTATVRSTPVATISGTTTVCQNSAAPLITFTNPQSLPVTISYNINGVSPATVNVAANSSATVAAPTSSAGSFVYNLVSVIYQTGTACSNTLSQSATVTVNPVPVPTLSSSDSDNILCAGTSVTFTAGGGTNYTFRIGTVTVQTGPSTTYTTSSLTNGQAVSVIVTGANSCSASSSVITNFVNTLPFIFITTAPTCSGDYSTYSLGVTVSAGGAVTSTAGIVTNTSGNIWSITGITSGVSVIVTVTDASGCESVLVITAPNCSCPVIQAPVSGGDRSYCATGTVPSVNATVSAGETVDWYGASSGGLSLAGGNGTLSYTPTGAGTYYAMTRNITSGCLSSTRTPVTVTMNPLPVASLISSDSNNSFCTGTSITFTAGGGTGYNFRVGGSSVQTGASATFTTTSLTHNQVVDVIVTNSFGCVSTSSGITNTVNPLPAPTLLSSDVDNRFCSGTSVTFTAGGGSSYNFRVGGVSVQNSAITTYTSSTLTNGQIVDVIVTNSNGCSATSAAINNIVYALPVPTLVSTDGDNIICAGTSVTFTATGGTGYNFRVNGVSVQSGASASYTTSTLTNGQSVDVIVSNANGCIGVASPITTTVNSLPATVLISTDPDNSFCAGTSVTFTAGGGTSYNFRVGGVSVQNGASSSYTTSSLANNQVVDVIVTNANNCSATSSGITNTVFALPVPTLTSSDPDNILCAGTSVTFTAGGGSSYNFRVGGVSVQNGATSTYTTSSLTNGQVVDVIVTNGSSCIATSSVITNFVNQLPLIFIAAPATCSPDLTTYSLSVAAGSGTVTSTAGIVASIGGNIWSVTGVPSGVPVTVRVTDGNSCESFLVVTAPNCSCPVIQAPVSGGDRSYCVGGVIPSVNATVAAGETIDWYGSSSGGTPLISTSLSYTPAAAGTFYAMARNTTTGCLSSTRTPVIVTMNPLPVPTLVSSDPDNTFCSGTSVTFTAGGGTNYNFRVGATTVQNGTSATYTTSSITNGQIVTVIVTNANSCSATSAGITNTVNPLPVPTLVSSDANNRFCIGTSVTFTAGGGTSYNFRVGGVSVQNGATSTYTTSLLTNGQIVDVIVTNSNSCVATSASITNTVDALPVPTLSSSDADNIFCTGTSITFTAGGGTSYNFRVGGVSVQSGALASYTTSSLTNGQVVDVIVTNASTCTATSAGIANTVNALPVPTLSSSDADNRFCSGTSVTFTAGGGTSYNFRVGGTSVQSGSSATYTTTSLTNGQVVTVIVTNSNGCIATSAGITNTVYALPVPTLISSDPDNTFCSGTSVTFTAGGGTSYNFRVGGTSVQSGPSATYTTSALTNGQVVSVIVTNANSCLATSAGITNTVNALPVPTLISSDADNIFCAGTSVTFTAGGGTNYNFRVDGVTVQNGASDTYTTNSLTNGQVVSVIVTNSNNCIATSAGITNTVNAVPVANAGTGGNECDLNFRFNAVPSIGVGTWTLTSGPGSAIFTPDANTPNATVTVSVIGTYTFTWTEVSNSCSGSSTVNVNFLQQPVANAGTGGNYCGLVYSLSAVPSIGTGTWTQTSGPGTTTFTPDANTANASATVSLYGTYTFTWTEVNGNCSASAPVTVTYVNVPLANAGVDGSVCDLIFGLNALPGTGAGPGTWTRVSGPGNVIFSPNANQPNAKVTVDQYGTYDFAWTEVSVACQSTDIVRVIFRSLPVVSAGNDTTICISDNIELQGEGTGSFLWEPSALIIDPTLQNPIALPLSTTTFKVTLTDQYGCKNSDEVVVEVKEIPIAYAGEDLVLEYLFGTELSASAIRPDETGTWSVFTGTGEFADASSAITELTGLSLGENIILWTVTNNVCPPSNDYMTILINDLVVPTLITPNMDGKNDYFILQGIETLGKTELVIFDRRGAQVYKNSNYDNTWNGVDYNENPLPNDTYFFNMKTESGKTLKGYIVIRR